ncbi:polysaccharide lyase family 8 super-sandwich domain-containing protein [Pseudoduganella sp. OTU4001]|uniref:polysaccharide lyase family 8 super-sandwich domain-containing protein n=1 Tax=Pseudoduganella sp. OTU4001 TaxID=3043854 RepID=UPI00313DFE42
MRVAPLARHGLFLAALLQICAAPAHADTFDDLRIKWKSRSSSAPPLPANDPDVAMQVASAGNAAEQYWTTMDLSAGRTSLWADLPFGIKSGNINSTVSRLNTLASAYNSSSSPYYQNPDVRQAVLDGFDWLLANVYSSTGTGYDNWYDWQIGTPLGLTGFMMTFYSELSLTQIAAACASIDHYLPDPTVRAAMDGTIPAGATVETGANRLDKALAFVLRGILGKDGSKIAAGRDAIPAALAYVTTGDGYYTDGSFIQHLHEPYIGGYGTVLLADINKLYYILKDSDWPISGDPNYLNPFDWAMNAYRPFIFDGAVMDNQRGRTSSRQFANDHFNGRQIVNTLAELAQVLPTAQSNQLKSVLKGWVERDGTFGESYFTPVPSDAVGGMSGVPTFDIALIKAIMNDSSIPSAPEPIETRFFPSADRAVSRGDGYAFALSMFSKRMSAFEYGNGENLRGWWTGVGMTYLYNADLTQYSNNFWATVDMWRLPGTTTDRSGSGTPVAWKHYGNTKSGVGGAELNRSFATAAMEFALDNNTGSKLAGKKAWFMFGDRIVAVGSGITGISGASVETIVENRALNGVGDNGLTVNSVANTKPATLGWSESMPATSWTHLAGNTSWGSDIGYVFPDQPAVSALRETRSGAWSDVNTGGTADVVSNNFLSLALDHGVNPTNAAYTYILLPNRTAQETAEFAAANPITVIERSTSATAVKDTAQGVTGVVFWNDSSKTVNVTGQPFLTSDKKAVATLQQIGNDMQLAVADPTQLNTGVINLELNRSADSIVSKDAAITVSQLSPTIKMQVAVNGSLGKSFKARFALNNLVTLAPGGDAYVRDGTYANNNFGSTTTLTVKQDATSFSRKSVLKFDLSSISGTITSAKLKLVPVVVGTTGIVHNLYQTTTDNWTEGSMTWNTLPANGSLLASWTVPAVNTPVEINLTSAANGVLSGSKVLSLKLESAANYGGSGSVDYASKEHSNLGYRPVLVVTSQ